MAQFPTPFAGKLFIVFSEVLLYAKNPHKSVTFQICSLWIMYLSEMIVYLICDVFADPLNTYMEFCGDFSEELNRKAVLYSFFV